ncbi:MAG TPA: phenylacetic acid degradation operon negative regulatory protein PaaX [Alphaproteobacteria bacterium]|jgi:phenylacetic acid degradation operon negative regulatory protein|nr:phenylacetic acid degradation operon negative regulatory protein PaaX [Alphaproteobacteria bacterium]
MAEPNRRLQQLVDDLPGRLTPRAKSLLLTIWGDAIAPHGGAVWLGSLIRLAAPLGLNERLVRTGVHRLVRDGWLAATPLGRRSYYSLTEFGRRGVQDSAHRRIYAAARVPWNGGWQLVLTGLGDIDAPRREQLKRELRWLGYGAVTPGVFAHPGGDADALGRLLSRLGVRDQVQVMNAQASGAHELLRASWDLDALAAAYRRFLDHFRPVWQAFEAAPSLDPAHGFLARILAIHEYRRIVLRDPELPDELLPADWAGAAARALCRNLYRLTTPAAEQHLMATLETAEGPLPEAAPYFWQRFGGLPGAPMSLAG